MLRATLPISRTLVQGASRQVVARQWVAQSWAGVVARRGFADNRPTDRTVLPGSQSSQVPDDTPAMPILTSPITPATPSSAVTLPVQNVPLAPPTPEEVHAISPSPTRSSIPPPSNPPLPNEAAPVAPAPPPPPPRKRRRGLRFFLYLTTILGLSYAGGTYYSLVSDNFHDFFTEYVPYGEEAVGYFEEREFKRRFPDSSKVSPRMYPQVSGEKKVTISGKSGMSPRLAEDKTSDLGSKGRHVSALSDADRSAPASGDVSASSKPQEKAPAQKDTTTKLASTTPKEKFVEKKPEPAKPVVPAPKAEPAPAPASATAPAAVAIPEPAPAPKPIVPIDPLRIDNAADPFVQEVTKILNDLIQVVNADNASDKYSSTMTKAKEGVQKLASDVATYRATESLAAQEKIRESQTQFDNAAKELVNRVREEQKEQELRWREEYEAERERLAQTYQEKLNAEIEVAQKIADQRLRNELLEQDIKLKDTFSTSVRDRIETERGARLSKLTELSSTVSELESLTSKWNEVVESNLKTQHLVVAVEAVKSILETADRPTPFLHQLVALKEIGSDDPLVNAAIGSINPAAYQHGVPTSAQLVDRFRRVAGEVRKAALLPEDAGVASHAASFVLSKLLFKKQGLAVGEDVESILTRTETLLEEGDLDEATREMNGLAGWAKVLSKDWLADCRRVLEVRQALDVIATEARRQTLMVE